MIARVGITTQGFLWQHPWLRANLLRIIGASALLLAEVLLGFLVGRGLQLLAMALVALPGVYFLLVYQRFGAIVVLAAALFVPFTIPTGTTSEIVVSMLLTALFVVLWLLRQLIHDKRLSLQPTPANTPLLLFMITVVVSLLWSNAFRDPLVHAWGSFPFVQAASTAVMLLLGGAFLLVVNTVDSLRTLKGLVLLFLLAGVPGYLDLGLVQTRGVFTMWVIALAYSQVLFNRRLPWWLRLACLGLTVMWMEWSMLRRLTWLSSWLPSTSVFMLLTLLRSKKLFLILMIIGILFLFSQKHVIEAAWATEADESGNSRFAAWEVNWRVTGRHLLFGTGPAGYAAYYMTYWPNEGMATHSNYIDIVAETGILGLFFYLWFFGAIAWSSYRLLRRLRDRGGFAAAYAAAALTGCIGALIAMGLGDWVIPFAYTQGITGYDYAIYTWLFLGGLYIVERLAPLEQDADVGNPAQVYQS